MWPVGIAGGLRFEGPVCENDTVIGWHAAWGSERLFQVDFAGKVLVVFTICTATHFC